MGGWRDLVLRLRFFFELFLALVDLERGVELMTEVCTPHDAVRGGDQKRCCGRKRRVGTYRNKGQQRRQRWSRTANQEINAHG